MSDSPTQDRLAALCLEYELPRGAESQLAAVLRAVENEHSSISTVRSPAEAVERHVEDSLVGLLAPELRGAVSVADLGAGGGFPGLVIAAALPHAAVTLIESVSRKCAFLERAALEAGLGNVEVVCARAEELVGREFAVVTARALASLPVLAEYAAPILPVGGYAVLWKGAPDDAELQAGARAAEQLGLEQAPAPELPTPASGHQRQLVIYRKVAPTPAGFPRRVGVARKRPLGS